MLATRRQRPSPVGDSGIRCIRWGIRWGSPIGPILVLFTQLEWDQLKKDLAYLCEKGYVQRIIAESEPDARLTAWRKRWFRLTSSGVEVADHCVEDKALEI